MGKRLTTRNAAAVFERVLRMPKRERAVVLDAFDAALDELLAEDFFGTEGQTDPRGDHRD